MQLPDCDEALFKQQSCVFVAARGFSQSPPKIDVSSGHITESIGGG
jgi:hypothetical protein